MKSYAQKGQPQKDELVTKDLDEIVGDEVTRDESIDQIQKQLNLVLKLENKVHSEAPNRNRVFSYFLVQLEKNKITVCPKCIE